MKHLFTLICIAFAFSSFAQISIVRTDYGTIGDKVLFAVDTPAAATLNTTIQLSGANVNWDFTSDLTTDKFDSNVFVSPTTLTPTPDSANILVISATGKQFEKVDSNFVQMIIDRPNNNIRDLNLKVFQFPITYGSVLTDTLNYFKIGTPADFNAALLTNIGYDSLKAIITAFDTTTCIGWGTIHLPDTTCNVLLTQIITVSNLLLYGHFYATGWSLINSVVGIAPHQRMVEYQWIGKNSKSYIARAVMDTNGINVKSFTYRYNPNKVSAIKSLSPASAQRGQILDVTVNTTQTHFTQTGNISVSLYQGTNTLLINSVSVINDTTLKINITLTQNNPTGVYDMMIKDSIYGRVTKTSIFQLNTSTSLPALTHATPTRLIKGPQLYNMTIYGTHTHFTQGSTVTFYAFGIQTSSVKVVSFTATNDSVLTGTITTDSTLVNGSYDIHISNFIDGTLILSGAFLANTGINEVADFESSIQLFPNPASDLLHLSFTQQSSEVTIQLFDITGHLIKSLITYKNNPSIDISELSNGLYFVSISGKNFTASRKIMINK